MSIMASEVRPGTRPILGFRAPAVMAETRSDGPRRSLPSPRGPLSAAVLSHLMGGQTTFATSLRACPLDDDDLHLALYCCYELHHRGLPGVDDSREWDPALIGFRSLLEREFERSLLRIAPLRDVDDPAADLSALSMGAGPSLSKYMSEEGTIEELREFAAHRSIYQLKEADPHSWGIPRFAGPSRAALVEIQADEYGSGEPGRSHAELFANTMVELGLDDTYGAYLDEVPGITLATVNLVEMFGLNRRLLPALIGHLALFEMTSVTPMSRYATACQRLGLSRAAVEFYDVHVAADEHHGELAVSRLVGDFPDRSPRAMSLIVWGAETLSHLERRFTEHLLRCWALGRTSLRRPLPDHHQTKAAAT